MPAMESGSEFHPHEQHDQKEGDGDAEKQPQISRPLTLALLQFLFPFRQLVQLPQIFNRNRCQRVAVRRSLCGVFGNLQCDCTCCNVNPWGTSAHPDTCRKSRLVGRRFP